MNENVSVSEHIREFAYFFSVFYRLIERVSEVVRAENRQIRIVRFSVLERVSVYNREIVVVILLRDVTAGVLTESTDFVFERKGVADEFRLV